MGLYINPSDMTKEQFLAKHAEPLHTGAFAFDDEANATKTVVCLIDNRAFTAAGVCYDAEELSAFHVPDGRPRKFFTIEIEKLAELPGFTKPVLDGLRARTLY